MLRAEEIVVPSAHRACILVTAVRKMYYTNGVFLFLYFRLGKTTAGLHLISDLLVAFCPCWKTPSYVLHLPSPLTLTFSLRHFGLCWI